MENVLYNIGQVLGITIIHSLWQGLFIYFILRLALMFGTQLSASKKYLFALTCLMAINAWFVYTLINEIHIYNWLAVAPKLSAIPLMLQLPTGIHQFSDQSIRYYYSIENYLPYITLLYVAGLLFNIGRLILGRRRINNIRRTMSIDFKLQYQMDKFTDMLNIPYKVRVGLSKLVDVPCMVGYFKPVILLPFTLSTYLGAEEIEAILLHELAHIKRNDYLVNLLQQVITTLLFFNPCAQLINRIINEERENNCDDLVVKTYPNPIVYAKALLKLEQTRENNMRMAMQATGQKYQLLSRIERIMKTKKPTQSIRPALLAMLILTIGIGCIALLNPQIAQGKISVKAIVPTFTNLLTDTTKKTAKTHSSLAVKKSVKGKIENNIIVSPYGISNDEKLEQLTAEVEKHSQIVNNYYNSPEFNQQIKAIEQKRKAIEDYYNNPNVRKLHDEQESLNKDFEPQSGEMAQISEKMGAISQKMAAYYDSKEFEQLISRLETKYGIPHKRYYANRDTAQWDEKYKKFQAEIAENMPTDVKNYKAQLALLNKKMMAMYDTPEFRERTRKIQELTNEINSSSNNVDVRQHQMEMALLSDNMKSYQNSSKIKNEQKLLAEASKKLEAYTNSPEFKSRMRRMTKFSFNYKFNDNIEKPERPERPEKMQKEAPEQPEAPETPAVPPVSAPTPPAPPAN